MRPAFRAEALAKRVRNIDWRDLQAAARTLGQQVRARGKPIGLVITPGTRGGIVAELMVRELTGKPPPVLVGITRPTDLPSDAVTGSMLPVSVGPNWTVLLAGLPDPKAIKGTVLIVDDFVRAGDFLANCKDFLVAEGIPASRIVSAAVVVTTVAITSNRCPDFYSRKVSGPDFSFPWGPAA